MNLVFSCPKIDHREMKKNIILIAFLFVGVSLRAQTNTADSLLNVLNTESNDSKRFLINYLLADYYEEWKIDSSLFFTEEAIRIAVKHDQKLAVAAALNTKGYQLSSKGN